MKAGKLDRLIGVQREIMGLGDAEALDDYGVPQDHFVAEGETLSTWVTVISLRAEIVKRSSEEHARDFGASTEQAITFRTRFADVRLSDRIVFEGRAHDVKQIDEIGRRMGLEIRTMARGAIS